MRRNAGVVVDGGGDDDDDDEDGDGHGQAAFLLAGFK